jgi:hypothetical protein
MDFANDEGRLAIFPSAPYGTDPFDEFLAANFPRSGFLVGRLAERLTQALGRMTRADDDWAVCVLEGADLVRLLSRNDVLNLLPRTLVAEIEEAFDRAEFGLEGNVEVAVGILARDEAIPAPGDWRRPSVAVARWEEAWAEQEARFGDALYAGTHDVAIAASARLLDALGDHSLRAWWLYLKAWSELLSAENDRRLDRLDVGVADLSSAVRAAGPTTWFGRVAASANRLRPAGADPGRRTANPIAEFAIAKTDRQIERWVREVDANIRSTSHNPVVQGWSAIGEALGYSVTRPTGGGATDSRWQTTDVVIVWEAKIEHEPGTQLARRDVNQLLGQIEEERPGGQACHGAFLTPMTEYHTDVGQSADGVVIFPITAALDVWRRVQSGFAEVTDARHAGHPNPAVSPAGDWLARVLARARGGTVTTDLVRQEWGRHP